MNYRLRIMGCFLAIMIFSVGGLLMPEETTSHTRTLMSYPDSETIWGSSKLVAVQQAIVSVANAIAVYEPVTLFVDTQRSSVPTGLHAQVSVHAFGVDDLWMRDTSCLLVYDCVNYTSCKAQYGALPWPTAPLRCVGFNFNGWGGKQTATRDRLVAAEVASLSGVSYVQSTLTMEGGSIEVDGEGTALATESSIINSNRNNGWTKGAVETELMRTLGIEKVIWSAGIAGRDITDGHIDFYARFSSPGVVVVAIENDDTLYDYNVTRQVLADLTSAVDAKGRALVVHTINNPSSIRPTHSSDDFAASYINYYVGNGFVLVPQFGSTAEDAAAVSKLQELYPGRSVETIDIDAIAYGGGGIHCATQQQPVGSPNLSGSGGGSYGITAASFVMFVVALLS